MSDRVVYIECQCNASDHLIKIVLDKYNSGPEMYICTQLNTTNSFFKRCIYAIKHIFKKDIPYGNWQETVIKHEDVDNLISILKEYKKLDEEAEEKNK